MQHQVLAISLTFFLSIVSWTPVASGSSVPEDSEPCDETRAAEIFTVQTCTRCHSVADETGERTEVAAARLPPSAGRLHRGSAPMTPERLRKLLEKRFDGRGMRHPVSWRGGESDLACLVAWLTDSLGAGSPESTSPDRPDR